MSKTKVTFLRDYEVADHRAGTRDAERYKKGKSYDLDEASAQHFLTRGACEIHRTRTRKPKKAAEPKQDAEPKQPATELPPAAGPEGEGAAADGVVETVTADQSPDGAAGDLVERAAPDAMTHKG